MGGTVRTFGPLYHLREGLPDRARHLDTFGQMPPFNVGCIQNQDGRDCGAHQHYQGLSCLWNATSGHPQLSRNLIDRHLRKPAQSLKRPKRETDTASRDTSDQLPKMVQVLATLALRRESQLQAIAVQDTFILFLQPGTSSIIESDHGHMETGSGAKEGHSVLITMITQTLLDRMLLRHHLELPDLESERPPSSGDEQTTDEYAESPRGTGADKRCLGKRFKLGRLRPHTVRENPIAASLAKGCSGPSRKSDGMALECSAEQSRQ